MTLPRIINDMLYCVKKPDLDQLFLVYEQNFRRLLTLVPDLGFLDGTYHSDKGNDQALSIDVMENSDYYTLLVLTQYFGVAGQLVPDPIMKIRLYWDARSVEVLFCQRRPVSNPLCTHYVSCLHHQADKVAVNCFLGEWLDHCIKQGHRFQAHEQHHSSKK